MDPKILNKLSYGMYVVSSKKDGKFNGQLANSVFQVTSEPRVIAISINKQNLTNEFIRESKVFTVSILSTEAPMAFIGKFGFKSGRNIAKFQDTKYRLGISGAPVALDYAIAFLEAEVINSIELSTHTLFFGNVTNAEFIEDKEPMTYAYYHDVIKGLSPKTAPTYLNPKNI